MPRERGFSRSPRIVRLAEKFRSAPYRHSYVAAHTRQFLARQIRDMRGNQSQADFGKLIDQPQNVVSRYEDPAYGKWTLSTLLDIAQKTDRALLVRFVDHKTFLQFSENQTEKAAAPEAYEQQSVDQFAWEIGCQQAARGVGGVYVPPPSASFTILEREPANALPILNDPNSTAVRAN